MLPNPPVNVDRPTASANSIIDAVVVTILCFGWFIAGSIGAVATGFPIGQFSDSSLFRIVLFEFTVAAVALGYLRLRGHSLAPLVPVPTAIGCLWGLALYAAWVIATRPLFTLLGASGLATQPIQEMVAGATITLPSLIAASIVNGLYEETFLIGYLLPALAAFGAPFAIGITVLVRVLYHLYQGPVGAVSVIAIGLIFAVYFWHTRKLWPVVFAHMFADLAGFAFS